MEILPLNSVIPSIESSEQCAFKKLKFLSKQSIKLFFSIGKSNSRKNVITFFLLGKKKVKQYLFSHEC